MSWLLWLLSNPLIALVLILGVAWFFQGQVRGRYFNPWAWFEAQREIRRLESVLKQNPHDRVAHADRGRLLVRRKRWADAVPHLESAASGPRPNAEALFLLGRAELALGNLDNGRKHIDQALELKGATAFAEEPWLALGDAYASRRDWSVAAEHYESATQANSSSGEAFFKLGGCYAELGRSEDAKRAWHEAAETGKSAPGYKRRQNRIWRVRAQLRKLRR